MATQGPAKYSPDERPSETYEDILRRDTRQAPAFLFQGPTPDLGLEAVAASRYFDPAFFQLEVEHVWSRVWQMACREEDIPNVGDYHIYQNVGRSLIVVRSAPDTIQAFHNVCLHRGRKLVTHNGNKTEFRCPFHGMTWACSGALKENPIAWDFPQLRDKNMSLPDAQVGRWGGFVFINLDKNAPPIETVLGPIPEHFAAYDVAGRYKAAHVVRAMPCNWKVAAEAFMESHHTVTTHPQLLPWLGDVNSQYDVLTDYVTRQFSAAGVASPFVADENYDEAAILRAVAGNTSRTAGAKGAQLPDGMTARAYMAEMTRTRLAEADGRDYGSASDAEMLDPLLYNVFPHFSVWAGYAPTLVYRWRPEGMNPDRCLMDVMILRPIPEGAPRPPSAPLHTLTESENWNDATELGGLAGVLEQDMANLPFVQEGLKASANNLVHFSSYMELRIRQLHRMLDRYIGAAAATR
ncbi:MAG: aromatic ring-hydroxylating dioxygenase subunit alpha [Rhodospirillales bacterium]|nr:aromatic ring-hydroxylating dioxygenase subunit alpha [Rhodospirillales bacterium]